MRATLFSAMKNEGPFILEWVAYHRLIGFRQIFVYTNDCDDGSAELLDALAGIGWVEHHDNTSDDRSAPQKRAAASVFRLPGFQDADLAIWLDADEFLNIHAGEGRLTDLAPLLGDATGMCINWRIFGSGGLAEWPGGLVTERFGTASRRSFGLNRQMKTLFRPGPDITGLYLHKPEVSGDFVANGGWLVNAAGERLPDGFYHEKRGHGDPMHELPEEFVSHRDAQINHYAVRSFDSYVIKRHRGNGWKSGREIAREKRSRYRLAFWNRHDRNEAKDRSILRHLPGLKALMAQALSVPEVRNAQDACMAAFSRETARLGPEIDDLWARLGDGQEDV